jgi:MoxR-like ATPase
MEKEMEAFRDDFRRVEAGLSSVLVGHASAIRQAATCLLAGGHFLIEGVPGLGKTLLARTLAHLTDLEFSRIQFTPDLLPADITGTLVLDEADGKGRSFRFQKGPIFGGLVLCDEVNRATPKTQAALLEAMQERAVTIGGVRHPLPDPFLVIATQNPIEMEGTYPLPEAQLDRFFYKVIVEPVGEDALVEVLRRTTGDAAPPPSPAILGDRIRQMAALARQVPAAPHILQYIARIVLATHPSSPRAPDPVKRYVRYGSSPRGAQSIALGAKVSALGRGSPFVSAEDVRDAAPPALRHRILLNFEGEAEGVSTDDLVRQVIGNVPDVPERVEKLLETN